MHIPDGFIDLPIIITLSVVSAGTIFYASKKTDKYIGEKRIPLMGIMAAFIFAVQMLNIPIPGGTSGHITGALLVAILLGPFTGFLVMSTVLILQCLIFQEGGLTALGVNIFNMGFIGALGGYLIYRTLKKIFRSAKGKISPPAVFIAALLSTVLAALACSIELSISGIFPFEASAISMTLAHSIIGSIEGVVTVIVLGFLKKVRPDLMEIEKV